MAREVIVEEYCDIHFARDERREVSWEDDVTIGPTTGHLMLCAECEPMITPLIQALQEFATPPTGTEPIRRGGAKAADKVECPVCHRSYASESSLNGHMNTKHGTSLAEYYGRAKDSRLPCPATGCNIVAKTPAGLGKHMAAKHPELKARLDAEKAEAQDEPQGELVNA
jgi:hypothetical protein